MQKITSADGLFHNGNPATGAFGTPLTADWHNTVQAEIIAPILAAGLTLDPNNNAQLLTAIQALIKAQANVLSAALTASTQSMLLQYGIGTNDLNDWTGDLNKLTTSGLWLAATNVNAPNPAISGWFVIVLPNGGGLYASQLAMPQGINELWTRTQSNGVWSAWSKLAGTDSPAFTGTPTVPTPATGANTLQAANAAFVQTTVAAAIAALVNAAPGALDTLKELATALGNDANFATTMTNALAAKAPLVSPPLTGTPTAPTPPASDNSNRISTTANVHATLAQYGLGTNDLSDWTGDLNALTTSGLWLASTNINAPNPAISAWFVIVLPNANGVYATQLAMPQSINELWFRAQNAGVWSSWIKVAGTDSPALTGTPTAPTAAASSRNTQLATTEHVQAAIDLRHATDWASYFCISGWIIQVGRVNVANTGAFTTVTFPVTFPNRLVSFAGNIISPGANVTSVLANADAATKTNIPVAVYNVGGAGGGTTPIFYIAIGF